MRFIFFVIALSLSSCATIKDPFFYEAVKGDQRIDLLGTVHITVSRRELPKIVFDRMKESSVAFFESALSDEMMEKIMHADDSVSEEEKKARTRKLYFVAPGEPFLDQRLHADEWKKLVSRIHQLNEKQLRYLNPRGAIAMLLNDDPVTVTRYEAETLNPYFSMDLNLARIAADQKIPVEGLDDELRPCLYERGSGSVSDLVSVLNGKSAQDYMDETFAMADAYREGNDAKMLSFIDSFGEDSSCILSDRNQLWAKKLAKKVKPGQKVFVAVGVAHLVSVQTESLLDLLHKQGYSIKRLKAE